MLPRDGTEAMPKPAGMTANQRSFARVRPPYEPATARSGFVRREFLTVAFTNLCSLLGFGLVQLANRLQATAYRMIDESLLNDVSNLCRMTYGEHP